MDVQARIEDRLRRKSGKVRSKSGMNDIMAMKRR
jgi:hypothetical protein